MSYYLWPPRTAAHQASLFFTMSWSLLRLMSIESVMLSSHLILCHPLLLLPPIPPRSESFPMSQLFASGGHSTGVSASASVLPMNIQDWFPLGLTGFISLQSKGLSRVFSKNSTLLDLLFFNLSLVRMIALNDKLWFVFLKMSCCSTPGLPVHHQLPEFTQTHVHWVGDDIQPSHLLLSPSPPAFNLSQHQGLFKWVSSSHQD